LNDITAILAAHGISKLLIWFKKWNKALKICKQKIVKRYSLNNWGIENSSWRIVTKAINRAKNRNKKRELNFEGLKDIVEKGKKFYKFGSLKGQLSWGSFKRSLWEC
jgi:hypothetical protein